MKKTLFFAFWVFALVVLSSCNLPGQLPQTAGSESPPGQDELVATLVAATLAAQPTAEIPLFPSDTPPPPETNTPEATATITLTPTPEVPTVSVSVATNCRTGPGIQFDQIGALTVGQSAEVVGRYQNGQYWIIKNPNRSGECWLWGNYATVGGNTASLPEFVSPPTPTPSLPLAPTDFNVTITCTLPPGEFINQVAISMTWADRATNESGYRVYRDNTLITTLGENATSANDNTTLSALWIPPAPKPSVIYGVEAFNSTGASVRVERTVSCP